MHVPQYEASLRIVNELLNDEDQSVKRRAVVSLVKIGGERCAGTLTELFTSKEFGLLPHNSKRSMLLVTRNLQPSGQRQVIQAVFGMKNLFNKKPAEDTKIALGEIMHLMHKDVAREILKKTLARASGGVRKTLESALGRLDGTSGNQ